VPIIIRTVNEIIQFLGAESNGRDLDTVVSGICQDSRCVDQGSLFVCICGKNVDGHEFALKAIEAGAGSLLVERYLPYDVPQIRVNEVRETVGHLAAFLYGHPSEQLMMVGVTGTNGKTTVAALVKHIASRAGYKTGLIGTLGVEV
jgi:UDP-N-acetylmuramoyl-L-alanyl-D-glutamate--2,6-diaminopimelate ligase